MPVKPRVSNALGTTTTQPGRACTKKEVMVLGILLLLLSVLAVTSLAISGIIWNKMVLLKQVTVAALYKLDQLEATNIDLEATNIELACRLSPSTYTWYLGMNLNPGDGNIMDYTTGWGSETSIGTDEEELNKDYKNQIIWDKPADYISIVRHQSGIIDAVKVFQFIDAGLSLSERFNSSNSAYYRAVVTQGGPIQENVAQDAENLKDDPMFSVSGDLVFNWGYSSSGTRVALTGGHLSPIDSDDENTHGFGNHFGCNPETGESKSEAYKHEISNIQDCSSSSDCDYVQVQGRDHGNFTMFPGSKFESGPVYGNYALYVSRDATIFPEPGNQLQLQIKQCD